jgi:hypothetical protein
VQLTCGSASGGNLTGSKRWAQTFIPPRDGLLTDASVFLHSNPAFFVLTFQIRTVDQGTGLPTSDLLAIRAAPLIDAHAGGAPRLVPATFNPPIPVTGGQLLALVITGTPSDDANALGALDGNPCPGGTLFQDTNADGTFQEVSAGAADLAFSLTIV